MSSRPSAVPPLPTNAVVPSARHQHRLVVPGQVQRHVQRGRPGPAPTAASASVQKRPPPRSTSVSLSRLQRLRQRPAVADQDPDHVADQAGHRRRPGRPCRRRRRPRPASGRRAAAPRRRSRRRPRRRRRSARTRRRTRCRRPPAAPAAAATLQRLRDACGARRGSARCRSRARPAGPRPRRRRPRPGRAGAAGAAADGQGAEPLPAGDQRDREALHRRRRAGPAPRCGTPRAGGPGSTPARSRPAPRAAAGSIDSSAWRGRGQPQPAPLVGGVHRAPLAEPGHHQLRDQRHRQLDVQRLGEQLARLGQERQPGLPADVGPAQPVVLQVQRQPLGGERRQRLGRTPDGAASSSSSPGVRPVHRSGTRSSRCRRARRAGRSGPAPGGRRPSPRSRRTAPPAAPTISASRASRLGRRTRRARSSAYSSGAVCSRSLSALGARRGRSVLAVGGAPAGAAGRRSAPGRSSRNQTPLPVGRCSGAPAAGEVVDQQQAAARARQTSSISVESLRAPTVSSSTGAGGEVGDRDGQPDRRSATTSMSSSVPACIDGVGGQLGGEQQRLVDQLVQAASVKHRADHGAGGGRRTAVGGQAYAGRPVRAPAVAGPASADTLVSSPSPQVPSRSHRGLASVAARCRRVDASDRQVRTSKSRLDRADRVTIGPPGGSRPWHDGARGHNGVPVCPHGPAAPE